MIFKPSGLFNMAVLLLSSVLLSGCILSANDQEQTDQNIDYLEMQKEAEIAYKNKQYTVAEEKYTQIAKAVHRDANAWFKLGNIYARTNRPALSIKAYQEAVIRDPQLSKAWHNMGIIYIRQATSVYISLQEHAGRDEPLRASAIDRVQQLNDLLAGKKTNDVTEKIGLSPEVVEKYEALDSHVPQPDEQTQEKMPAEQSGVETQVSAPDQMSTEATTQTATQASTEAPAEVPTAVSIETPAEASTETSVTP